ncbi:hypothetical protein CDD81_1757 [Ophiocordyceps australis]|uniref:Enterotoxin n=1 Tax=Ophiocordyceps australis TaxID=1399860 RepID=A0A2C5YFM4_9HYPO|nr:hypothetical protein CDD81_1757 [Ophiocordyceps australis]
MVGGIKAFLASSLVACSLFWPTSVIATPVTPAPPMTPAPDVTFTHSMGSPGVVYAIVYPYNRGEDAIDTLRNQGGLVETANPSDDAAWGWDNFNDGRTWISVTTNLEGLVNRAGSRRGWWVLRIATSPHMISLPDVPPRVRFTSMMRLTDPWSEHRGINTHVALNGIPMSQVQAYASLDGRRPADRIESLVWQENPTYDARWAPLGINGQQPLLSGRNLPEGSTARGLARLFMNDLTSPRNTAMSPDQRQHLRELLGWNTDLEPNRDFPLVRDREPQSLTSLAMRAINWRFLNGWPEITQDLQRRLAQGLATLAECGLVYRAMAKKEKRQEHEYCDAQISDKCHVRHEPDTCKTLLDTVHDMQRLPSSSVERPPTQKSLECSEFNKLKVHLQLANAITRGSQFFEGAGSVDDIVLDIGHQTLLLAEAPSRGFEKTRTVNLKKAFGVASDSVAVKDVNHFKLYSVQDLQQNADSWELEGITFKGRCAGSGRIAQTTKWQSIEKWYSRFGDLYPDMGPTKLEDKIQLDDWHWETEDDRTRTLLVDPPGQPGACVHFSAVNATLELGSSILGAGTNHNIVIDFDHQAISLAEAPSKSYNQTRSLDMRDAFASQAVAVDSITGFRLYGQVPSGQSESSDEWELKSITLEGQCAESSKKAKLAKFHDLFTWQGRMNEIPGAFRAKMSLGDWEWA